MNTSQRLSIHFLAWLALISFGVPTNARAQNDFGAFGQSGDVFGDVNFGDLSINDGEPTTWSAKYYASGDTGRLEIEATVGQSWHVYSTTQPKGGPLRTQFTVASPDTVTVSGAFKPNEAPHRSVSDTYPGITIEEHDGVVVWSAALNVPAGHQGDLKVKVNALACQNGGSCMPVNETLVAKYAGPLADDANLATRGAEKETASAADKLTDFQEEDYAVRWKVGVSSSIASGGQGRLVFRAIPEATFHVYHAVVDDAKSSTNFVVTKKSGLKVGAPRTESKVIAKSLFAAIPGVPNPPEIKYHKGTVTWELPIKVSESTGAGEYEIEGYVCYQACTDTSCLAPKAMRYIAKVTVGDAAVASLTSVKVSAVKYVTAIDSAADTKWVDEFESDQAPANPATRGDGAPEQSDSEPSDSAVDDLAPAEPQLADSQNTPDSTAGDDDFDAGAFGVESGSKASFGIILLMAFGGGVILNLMPCVLPVVGIKIMSFVQQAGEDRRRVFALNFAYAAGILAVFALLAMMAAAFSFKWGQQFQYFELRLGLTVLIFAMALSYLGVWELPTPGVANSDASQNLQDRQDLTGAFFKGTFATVLATPCSGPMLGTVFGVTGEMAAYEKAIVFLTIGLGMAIPYVVLGLFPSAVKLLPKPGEWMVTLKEFLAFLFLLTVAYFFNQFADGQKVAVFVTLIGVWFGCWVIGKVPPWEVMQKQIRGWSIGVTSAVAVGWLAFTFLVKEPPAFDAASPSVQYVQDKHLKWEVYSEARLKTLQEQGKTVMIDFTAKWCPNCITNKHVALDTEATNELMAELNAVPMLADWTDQNSEIKSKLDELKSESIPILAIYPGSKPYEPIVLRDLVSQRTVLKALRSAGPSQSKDSLAIRNVKGNASELVH